MKKTRNIRWFKKRLDPIFNKYIRLRDIRCVRCGKQDNLQCSHSMPKSEGNILRYDEKNCITLCYHCHFNWWHSNPIEAGEWFKQKFPSEHKYLLSIKNKHKKFTEEELEELTQLYKQKIREIEQ